jgi:gas vesicle protein
MNDYERYGDYVERESGNAAIIVASLLIGVGIGALISLLFAPKSGQETRELLRRKYSDTVRGLSRQAGNLRRRGADLAGATRNKVMPFGRRQGQA